MQMGPTHFQFREFEASEIFSSAQDTRRRGVDEHAAPASAQEGHGVSVHATHLRCNGVRFPVRPPLRSEFQRIRPPYPFVMIGSGNCDVNRSSSGDGDRVYRRPVFAHDGSAEGEDSILQGPAISLVHAGNKPNTTHSRNITGEAGGYLCATVS